MKVTTDKRGHVHVFLGKKTKDSHYTGGGSKFNEVKRQLAAVGISIKNNAEWEEYIVGGSYHTDDLQDALGTGLLMAKKKSGAKDCSCQN